MGDRSDGVTWRQYLKGEGGVDDWGQKKLAEVGECSVYSRNSQEANVTGAERARERGTQRSQGLDPAESFGFPSTWGGSIGQ